jgi:hypothetical protein
MVRHLADSPVDVSSHFYLSSPTQRRTMLVMQGVTRAFRNGLWRKECQKWLLFQLYSIPVSGDDIIGRNRKTSRGNWRHLHEVVYLYPLLAGWRAESMNMKVQPLHPRSGTHDERALINTQTNFRLCQLHMNRDGLVSTWLATGWGIQDRFAVAISYFSFQVS